MNTALADDEACAIRGLTSASPHRWLKSRWVVLNLQVNVLLGCNLSARRVPAARHAVARHQCIDQRVELVPIRFAIRVVADNERSAGVEFLVLLMTAGELRADHVPGELEQLHASDGVGLRRLPER